MIQLSASQLKCNKITQSILLNLINQLKTNKELAFETDTNHNTLLHHAAGCKGAGDLIIALVQCGVNLKAKNAQGNTALHIAAAHSVENAVLLMRLGAKDNVINNDALLPEDIFHQTFKSLSWFDIMPETVLIRKRNRYNCSNSQYVFQKN